MIRRIRLLVTVVALMAVMMTVTAGTASAHAFTGGPRLMMIAPLMLIVRVSASRDSLDTILAAE